jgi:zinc transporter ZupT
MAGLGIGYFLYRMFSDRVGIIILAMISGGVFITMVSIAAYFHPIRIQMFAWIKKTGLS